MKRMIILAAGIAAVMASANAASAQTAYTKAHHGSRSFVQRNVALPSQSAPLPNADLRYGPYPEYPQSPAGGGY
jgi:hypothetical protein